MQIVATPARYAACAPAPGSNESTVTAKISGPAIAAAREDKTIKLKNRPASSAGINVKSNGLSAVLTPP